MEVPPPIPLHAGPASMTAGVSPLAAWESFYVIVGSSAGALTGLQFVVMALNQDSRRRPKSDASVMAFGTPTVVHFCAVLLLAAVLSAPWPSIDSAALALLACGGAGLIYVAVVIRRARRQRDYVPVFEDWLWHTVFPVVGYLLETVAALLLPGRTAPALFGLGAAALLLIFTGIHNAWDAAVYIALGTLPDTDPARGDDPERAT